MNFADTVGNRGSLRWCNLHKLSPSCFCVTGKLLFFLVYFSSYKLWPPVLYKMQTNHLYSAIEPVCRSLHWYFHLLWYNFFCIQTQAGLFDLFIIIIYRTCQWKMQKIFLNTPKDPHFCEHGAKVFLLQNCSIMGTHRDHNSAYENAAVYSSPSSGCCAVQPLWRVKQTADTVWLQNLLGSES